MAYTYYIGNRPVSKAEYDNYRANRNYLAKSGKSVESTSTRYEPDSVAGSSATGASATSSSGTYSTGNARIDSLLQQLQEATDAANAANTQRAKEISTGYDDIISSLEGMGAQSKADIQSRYQQAASQGEQDLISRGLGSTTVLGQQRRGYLEDAEAAQNRLDESLRSQLAGYKTNKLGFMERINDVGPDISSYIPLITQYGAASTPATTTTRSTIGGSRYSYPSTTNTTGYYIPRYGSYNSSIPSSGSLLSGYKRNKYGRISTILQ